MTRYIGFILLGLLTLCILGQVHSVNAQETFTAPTRLTPGTGPAWKKLESKIVYSKDKDIRLIWQGNGGLCKMADSFIDALQHAKKQGKKITFNVTGPAISCHANIVCFASKYTMTEKAKLIYHVAFERTPWGTKVYTNDPEVMHFGQCERVGILTKKDINTMMRYHVRIEIDNKGKKVTKRDWVEVNWPPATLKAPLFPNIPNELIYRLPQVFNSFE